MLNFGASKPRLKKGPPWICTWVHYETWENIDIYIFLWKINRDLLKEVQCNSCYALTGSMQLYWFYSECQWSKNKLFSKMEKMSLLDELGCAVIEDFQMDQHHLMLKDDQTRPNMVTKRRCTWNKTFLLGSIVRNKVISCFISPLSKCFYIRVMPIKASNEFSPFGSSVSFMYMNNQTRCASQH